MGYAQSCTNPLDNSHVATENCAASLQGKVGLAFAFARFAQHRARQRPRKLVVAPIEQVLA